LKSAVHDVGVSHANGLYVGTRRNVRDIHLKVSESGNNAELAIGSDLTIHWRWGARYGAQGNHRIRHHQDVGITPDSDDDLREIGISLQRTALDHNFSFEGDTEDRGDLDAVHVCRSHVDGDITQLCGVSVNNAREIDAGSRGSRDQVHV